MRAASAANPHGKSVIKSVIKSVANPHRSYEDTSHGDTDPNADHDQPIAERYL
jgi:hypothetical protein